MAENETCTRTNRRLRIGLVVLGAILALAVVAVVLYFLVPGILERIGLVHPTPTPEPVAAPTAPASPEAGTPTETQQASPLPTPASGLMSAEEFDDLLAQADALVLRSKIDEAIAIYESLTRQQPQDFRPEAGWAWALIYDDRAQQALSHAERAAELNRGSGQAATVRSRAYAAMGDAAQALLEASRAIQLEPGNAEAHAAMSDACRLSEQNQEALKEAELALVQDSNNANAHRARAWLYRIVDQDYGQAAGELQVAAGIEPELWLRRHELGQLLLEAGDPGMAVVAFQDAVALRPKAVTYAGLGTAFYQLQQYAQAAAALEQAMDLGLQDADAYAVLASAYAHQGQCDQAEAYSQRALALVPDQSLGLEASQMCEGATGGPTAVAAPSPTLKPTRPPVSLSGWIAFPVWNAQTGKYDTYLGLAKDGSGRRLVVSEMHQPALSPDGKWLAVNGEMADHMNLFVVRPDGSSLMEITPYTEDGQPVWSPDGLKLAISSYRHGGDRQSRIYILDDIPFGGGKVEGRVLNHGLDDIRGEMPAWTANGQIVYRGCDIHSPETECWGLGLFSVSSEPGAHTPKQLTDEPTDSNPAVSRGAVAFMSSRSGNWEIYVMDLDGSGVRQLTDNTANDGLPAWAPDGRTIAFVSDVGGVWAVWAMNPDGSNRRKLFDIGGAGLASDWPSEQIGWAP